MMLPLHSNLHVDRCLLKSFVVNKQLSCLLSRAETFPLACCCSHCVFQLDWDRPSEKVFSKLILCQYKTWCSMGFLCLCLKVVTAGVAHCSFFTPHLLSNYQLPHLPLSRTHATSLHEGSEIMFFLLQRHVVDTVFGYDDDSMDSETSSVASYRTDRTPATPDDDLDEVRSDSFHRKVTGFQEMMPFKTRGQALKNIEGFIVHTEW